MTFITNLAQHLVLVEDNTTLIYFEEIFRQQEHQLFTGTCQIRFATCRAQNNQQACREKLVDIADKLEKLLMNKFNEYTSSFVTSTREINETDAMCRFRVPEAKLKTYVNNLNRLEKLPKKFFQDIQPHLDDPSLIDVVRKVANFFDHNKLSDDIESIVDRANILNTGNYTFGLLNGKHQNETNMFILRSGRNSIENFVYDPLNLFFALRRMNIKNAKADAIMQFVCDEIEKDPKLASDLDREHVDLDNWNRLLCVKKLADGSTCCLEKLLNIILNVVQNFILKETVVQIDNMSSENINIQVQNMMTLHSYNYHILYSNLPLETIASFFIGSSSRFQQDFLCVKDFVKYLIDCDYNFLVSQQFVDQVCKKILK